MCFPKNTIEYLCYSKKTIEYLYFLYDKHMNHHVFNVHHEGPMFVFACGCFYFVCRIGSRKVKNDILFHGCWVNPWKLYICYCCHFQKKFPFLFTFPFSIFELVPCGSDGNGGSGIDGKPGQALGRTRKFLGGTSPHPLGGGHPLPA